MSFDGLMLHHIIQEYHNHIIPSKIEGVFFELPDRFIFHLYHGLKYQLVIDLNAQGNKIFYETTRLKPSSNHPFLNSLRKYLSKASIQRIKQHRSDRVLIFDIKTYDAFDGVQSLTLVFEAMGKHANLILIKDNVIIDAYKKVVSMTHRSVYPNIPYQFFPSDKVSFFEMDQPSDDSVWIQQTYEGISPQTAKYLAQTFIRPQDIKVLPTLMNQQMFTYHQEGGITFESFNDLMKQDLTTFSSFVQERHIVHKALLKKQQKHGYLIEDLEEKKQQLLLKEQAERLLTYPYQQEKHASLYDIQLDATKTIIENVNMMFDTYKKASRSLYIIESQIELNLGDISNLEQLIFDLDQHLITHLEAKQMMIDLNLIQAHKKETKAHKIPYKHIHKDTFEIFYGTNAIQNNHVTHHLAKSHDYFMHVKDAPGAHVIYRGVKDDEGFQVALKLAAYHSKLKYSTSIPVNVTLKKYVKKIPGLFGSYVRLTTYQTIYVDIDDDFVIMWDNV